jgi:hypothetical protein
MIWVDLFYGPSNILARCMTGSMIAFLEAGYPILVRMQIFPCLFQPDKKVIKV